ncbi:LysE family transporter [Pseudomonas sp. LS-2]|uniref:LysE family transporter n=1 Tax=Pseudomonas sp. LS-2 TaxID=2315859 RepID=UPI000E74C5A1|nr:hypothetical protein D3M70_08000 [Pseudomonas sp. LS-2]
MATNLANPTAAFFIASIFTTALPNGSDAKAYVASVLAVTIVACGVYATIAVTFSLERVQATYRRSWRAVDAILGACFIGLAAKLAWQR